MIDQLPPTGEERWWTRARRQRCLYDFHFDREHVATTHRNLQHEWESNIWN